MKLLTDISRVLVGSLFIVSGLIKANDPLGFSYKLEEYFSVDVLNMSFLDPFVVELAVFICVAEIVLGIAVLLGSKMKLAAWSLLLMILFFTFLTFYSAYFDKVTDCGCFGDALKLTPWQSFWKDIVLLFFVLIIFINQKKIQPNLLKSDLIMLSASLLLIAVFAGGVIGWWYPFWFAFGTFVIMLLLKHLFQHRQTDWMLAATATFISLWFSVYCIRHLPMKDFRPYAVDKNIALGMEIPEGKQPPEYAYIYTLKHKQSGENKEINSKDYVSSGIWKDENWEITETSESILMRAGYEPPIHDFVLTGTDGNDYTQDILAEPYIFLLVSYDIEEANETVQSEVNKFVEAANTEGHYFYGLTASLYDDLEDFRHKHQNMFDFYSGDATMLKTIIRSNPGLVLLKEGTVIGKWHYNDFPEFENVEKEYLNN